MSCIKVLDCLKNLRKFIQFFRATPESVSAQRRPATLSAGASKGSISGNYVGSSNPTIGALSFVPCLDKNSSRISFPTKIFAPIFHLRDRPKAQVKKSQSVAVSAEKRIQGPRSSVEPTGEGSKKPKLMINMINMPASEKLGRNLSLGLPLVTNVCSLDESNRNKVRHFCPFFLGFLVNAIFID